MTDQRTLLIVLAGGVGTRLRPLTDDTPKPLVRLIGLPILDHILERLSGLPTCDVVLACGYRAEDFGGYATDMGRVTVIREPKPLGTGGALSLVARSVRVDHYDQVVVINGDTLTAHDVRAQLDHHKNSEALCTLLVHPSEDTRRFGELEVDDSGRIRGWTEKSDASEPRAGLINGGFYVMQPQLLTELPTGSFSLERDVLQTRILERSIGAFLDDSPTRDVGTLRSFLMTSRDMVGGKFPVPHRLLPSVGSFHASHLATIDPRAELVGGSFVDGYSLVRDSRLHGCVVMPGACVGDGADLSNVIVAPNATIPPGTCAKDACYARDGSMHSIDVET